MHRFALVLVCCVPALAFADYRPGEVPEGTNAFVQPRHELRLSVLGASQLAITDHTELATYLLADALLFPNLRVEHQLGESDHVATSFMVGAGAGAYPAAVGAMVPVPGAVVGGGGAGIAWGALETATVLTSVRMNETTFSINAGGFAMEGGLVGVIGGAGAGGDGVVAGGGPAETHGTRTGLTAGAELSRTFGKHDAIVIAVDAWRWRELTMDAPNGLVYPRATWTHQWTHWQLSGGAYALIDLPNAKALHSKEPVAPFINVAWAR